MIQTVGCVPLELHCEQSPRLKILEKHTTTAVQTILGVRVWEIKRIGEATCQAQTRFQKRDYVSEWRF